MTQEEYIEVQSQVLLLGALVRDLDLEGFIAMAERADSVGPLLDPSRWIAARENLALVLTLARKLRAVQVALPSAAEAQRIDEHTIALRQRFGL